MPATTNNKKILDKEFLEDSIYLYDKNYTHKKQNIIDNQSSHISLETKDGKDLSKAILNINISNDGDRKDYDYLIAKKDGNNTLQWIHPVYSDEELSTIELTKYDRQLLSAKALNNFKGTTNIKTVGEITEGTWKAGKIDSSGDITSKGSLNIKGNISSEGSLTIKGKINSAGFETAATTTDTITATTGNITTLNTDKITNESKISTDTITATTGNITTLNTDKINIKKSDKKTDAVNITSSKTEIDTSTINLIGATTIKNSNNSNSITINYNGINENASTINLIGTTTIKNSNNSNSITINNDNIKLSGTINIADKIAIDSDNTKLNVPVKINSGNSELISISKDECAINNSSIKLGEGITVINDSGSWNTTINRLYLNSKVIYIEKDEEYDSYIIDGEITYSSDADKELFSFDFKDEV